jgi:uncharacterized coiled-coil protein SlyX
MNTCEIHAHIEGIAERTGCAVCLTEALAKVADLENEVGHLQSALRGEQGIEFPDGTIINVAAIIEEANQLKAEKAQWLHWSAGRMPDDPIIKDYNQMILEVEQAKAGVVRLVEKLEDVRAERDRLKHRLGELEATVSGMAIQADLDSTRIADQDKVINEVQVHVDKLLRYLNDVDGERTGNMEYFVRHHVNAMDALLTGKP